ncbi:MAG: hypothetical protein RHS_2320 [Robinsoniella sp. RHS]|nr:MAG: hypothetical protein RHS_2320 [Robinsoniella sp. RHS]
MAFVLGQPHSSTELINETLCLSIKFPIVFTGSFTLAPPYFYPYYK